MKTIKILLALVISFSSAQLLAQKIEIDNEKSSVEWLGKKIGGEHSGTINLKSGNIEIKDDKIISGEFVIDMLSIENTDISDETYKMKLIGHLKSDDFFGVEKYPSAKFVITEGGKFTNGKAKVTGKLTIKGKTEAISFDVVKKGNDFYATIEVDRSKYDVKYGSNSFFDNLGDKAIEDIFTLDVKLSAI